MSRQLQQKNKDINSLELVPAEKVWTVNKSGKRRLRKDLKIYGKIDLELPTCILSTNTYGVNNKFVDDFNVLPKKTKNEAVDFFLNNRGIKGGKRRVVYLTVKEKNKKRKKHK